MEKIFSNRSLIQLISKWRIHLLIISIVSVVIGIIISSPMVITPKYKSTAIVYPINLYEYSKESTTEQMFQILLSNDIKFKMLDAFQLDKHYKIDRKDPLFVTYFLDEYSQNVSINKTEFESVEIKVLDKDPKIAAAMVDSLIAFYNQKVAELHKIKQKEMITIMSNAMTKKRNEIDSLEKQLTDIRVKYGIINVNTQSIEATKGLIQGNKQAAELYKNLTQFADKYKEMDSLMWHYRKEFINYKCQYENAIREYNKEITYAQVVQKPFPADKKSYPVRWVIVALTLLGGLVMALIIISFIESKKNKIEVS
jgi:capsule polysaccharide export protein KpsE/RkpR